MLTTTIAKHLRDVHFGGNWTTSNVKEILTDVTWSEATTKVSSLNTIAALTFHINYFVDAVAGVLEGQPLTSKDKFSYDHPPINSEEDWARLVDKTLRDAERFAKLIEGMDDDSIFEDFVDPKYGHNYRNFQGMVEHTHYHLGQIAIIKKLIREADGADQTAP